ncbi:MAG: glycosyltransferase [Chloroflexi bacterium]|nr:glycosyltransferase [Chloroflexota bacterium]
MALRASVIIPAYNARGTLGACLEALLGQTTPREQYEVIVVDDASSDDTAAMAGRYPVQVLRQAHAGPAAARNLGARAAQGEMLLFLDADCVPTPGWLEAMLRPFSQPEIVGAKGRYRTAQRALVARFVQLEYKEKYQRMAQERYIDFIDTYSAAYRREVFLANGGFDTTFVSASAEDQEFSFRLAEQGLKMVFLPEAVVYHTHPASWTRYTRRKMRFGYWQALNRWKHPRTLIRDSHTPQNLKLQVALVALAGVVALLGLEDADWLWGLPALLACFLGSAAPLLRLVWKRDRAVLAITPAMLLLRAGGLLVGFGAGAVAFPSRGLWGRLFRRGATLGAGLSEGREEPP